MVLLTFLLHLPEQWQFCWSLMGRKGLTPLTGNVRNHFSENGRKVSENSDRKVKKIKE